MKFIHTWFRFFPLYDGINILQNQPHLVRYSYLEAKIKSYFKKSIKNKRSSHTNSMSRMIIITKSAKVSANKRIDFQQISKKKEILSTYLFLRIE